MFNYHLNQLPGHIASIPFIELTFLLLTESEYDTSNPKKNEVIICNIPIQCKFCYNL